MSSIIDELRDDKNYYGRLGKSYLSNSDIGVLLSNPRAFRKEREETKAFAEGRLFHQLMLEPHKVENFPFVEVSSRNTKEYKNLSVRKASSLTPFTMFLNLDTVSPIVVMLY